MASKRDACEQKASCKQVIQQHGVSWLRCARLLPVAEWMRFHLVAMRQKKDNALFLKEYPDFTPPPASLLHDAHSTVSYRGYVESGLREAQVIADLIRKHQPQAKRVLEWGRGPGRVIRQLPGLLPQVAIVGLIIIKIVLRGVLRR